MKLLARAALVASVVAVGLLAAVPGYALSKVDDSGLSTSGDSLKERLRHRPGGSWAAMRDSKALGGGLDGLGAIALGGGSLTIATLLSGGTLLMRQRWQAQVAALEAETDLSLTTETETVLVSEPAEIESEVALAYRR